jgi:hypothetical protein
MHRVSIERSLDLHDFQPHEIPDVFTEYVAASFADLRIVHGLGTGAQRSIVQK